MHQRALRTVVLIQAIEETDRVGEVIPLADRAEASRAVARDTVQLLKPRGGAPLSREAERFLARRAHRLLVKLRARSPAIDHVLALSSGLTWLGRVLLVLAFAAGVSLAALDGSRRINILAFPLIGLIAWNLVVYLLLIVTWIRARSAGSSRSARRSAFAAFFERWISGRIESLMRHSVRFNVPLSMGLRRFVAEWSEIAQPLLAARAKRLLHLAAVLVAVGLIASLYVRGVVLRYEAGWESTFIGPQTARTLLETLYGPASAISGIAIPPVGQIQALRWTATGGGSEAASWIHLIALTAVLYIIVPRAMAALTATFDLWRFARRPTLPPSLLGYARTLVMGASAGNGNATVRDVAIVTPYAYEPDAKSVAGLEDLLFASLGANLHVQARQPIRYGEEEAIASRLADDTVRSADWNVIVMTLAATPEVENHGALISGVRDWLTQNASTAPLLIVIDEAPYALRMQGDPVLERRLQERRNLWREFVAGYGLRACIVNLAQMKAGSPSETAAQDAARAALWTASERS